MSAACAVYQFDATVYVVIKNTNRSGYVLVQVGLAPVGNALTHGLQEEQRKLRRRHRLFQQRLSQRGQDPASIVSPQFHLQHSWSIQSGARRVYTC